MDSNQKQTYWLGSRHFSDTINQNLYKKVNTKSQKLPQSIKSKCSICGQKSQLF